MLPIYRSEISQIPPSASSESRFFEFYFCINTCSPKLCKCGDPQGVYAASKYEESHLDDNDVCSLNSQVYNNPSLAKRRLIEICQVTKSTNKVHKRLRAVYYICVVLSLVVVAALAFGATKYAEYIP